MLGIGFHITDHVYDYQNFIWWLAWVEILRPGWINTMRAAQSQEALEASIHVQNKTPTQVMIRNRYGALADGDERVLQVYKPNSTSTVDVKNAAGRYYKDFIQQYAGTGLTPVTANEITAVDYVMYSRFFGEVVRLAYHDGIRVAVGRFPTHHPLENTWESLIPLWETMAFYKNAVYSPNVYWQAGEDDGLRKLVRLLRYMDKEVKYRPEVVLGEFARLKTLSSAWDGWKTIPGLSEVAYAGELIQLYKHILLPERIYACVFDIGNWRQTFGIGVDFMHTLEKNYESLIVPAQGREYAMYVTPITATGFINIRSGPGISYADIGDLNAGEYIRVLAGGHNVGVSNQWVKVDLAGQPEAYVAGWLVKEALLPDDEIPNLPEDWQEVLVRLSQAEKDIKRIDMILEDAVKRDEVWSIWVDKIKGLLGF